MCKCHLQNIEVRYFLLGLLKIVQLSVLPLKELSPEIDCRLFMYRSGSRYLHSEVFECPDASLKGIVSRDE